MDIRKLQRAIVDGLEDVKGHNIVVFNTEHLSPLFERVIIASGTSNRQTKALASSVRDAVKSKGFPVMRTEGEANGEWIIVDCGAAVVHLMQSAIRDYYHLEEIWGEKPVRMKLDDKPVRLVKSSEEDEPMPATKAPAKKAASTKPSRASAAKEPAPAKKISTARKAAPETKAAPARKPAAKRAAGKASVVETSARKTAARKTAARKTATPKTPARKTAAKPGVTRTVGVKTTAAKKTPAKKAAAAKKSLSRA